MTDRSFAFHTVAVEGRPHSAMRIECSDCEKTCDFLQTGNGRRPPKAAEQYFRAKGWFVGNGPRRDLCPQCIEKRATHPAVKDEKPMKPISGNTGNTGNTASTVPRTMSRDDRRLIIAEIKGCYDEGNRRYMDGWHDQRVAQALGAHVPFAWVKECREDYFGEGASNAQFDELLQRTGTIEADLLELEKNEMRLAQATESLRKSMEAIKPLIRDVQRAIGK